MIENPLITIIVPTFNRAQYIASTLNSIKLQTYSNWECLIIDDHSTDDTEEIVQNFVSKDERFLFFKRENVYVKGASGSRNNGLDIAERRNARFIQFFDDDDIMHPKKLELQIEPFFQNPKLNFTICKFDKLVEMETNSSRIDTPEYQLDFPHIGDALLTGELKMNSPSAIWKMEVLNEFRFDERLDFAEEWELFTRIGYHYPDNYSIVDEYLFSYRKHPHSLTMGLDENYLKRKSSAVIRIMLMNYLSEHKLHTNQSLLFFTKTFLIYSYKPIYVKGLLEYIKERENFPYRLKFFLRLGLYLSKFHNKIITKLATWV